MFLIGSAIDIHRIEYNKNNNQKIGGVGFDIDYKIIANSDGDIILHAVANAILGALGVHGDIGTFFSENENRNLNSREIVNKSLSIMDEMGFKINNLDLTFVSEHILINNKREKILESLKDILNVEYVGLKGTRWEDPNKLYVQCNCSILLSQNIF